MKTQKPMGEDEILKFWGRRARGNSIDIDEKDPYWDYFEKRLVDLALLRQAEDCEASDRSQFSILDIGCGTGRLAYYLASSGYSNITCIDFVPECVEKTRARVPAIRTELMNAKHMRFEDSSFDVAIACRVFQNIPYVDGKRQALQEAARVTRNNGRIALIDGNGERITDTPTYNNYLSHAKWLELFSEYSLDVEETISQPFYTLLKAADKKLRDMPLLRESIEYDSTGTGSSLYKMAAALDERVGGYFPGFVSGHFGFLLRKSAR